MVSFNWCLLPFIGGLLKELRKLESEKKIKALNIRLEGFSIEEIKDLLAYIRSVEAHRTSRLVIANIETPGIDMEEKRQVIKEIFPDDGGTSFISIITEKREKKVIE